jgi:hypothetical protein
LKLYIVHRLNNYKQKTEGTGTEEKCENQRNEKTEFKKNKETQKRDYLISEMEFRISVIKDLFPEGWVCSA